MRLGNHCVREPTYDFLPRLQGPLRWAFFGWKSENVAGWPNTDLKVLEGNQAECPDRQMSAIGADSKCFGKQQSGNYA